MDIQDIVNTTIRHHSLELADNIKANSALMNRLQQHMKDHPPAPPTFSERMAKWRARVEDAIAVLRGDASADYYDE